MPVKVILVAGARPNFMKAAPLFLEMKRFPSAFRPILLHTGQHYDYEMSKVFFEDLNLPEPDYFLGVGSGTHAEQTARIMIEFEKVLHEENPNLVVVFGDVNSTLACSITAKKVLIPVAHVEAGLRSFDMTMPEEINRKVTDAISDILFTPSRDGNDNLVREGIEKDKIHFVGNIMIDSLVSIIKRIDPFYEDEILRKFGLKRNNFVLVTVHRPSNVDDKNNFLKIINFLDTLSARMSVIFPIHPRTKNSMKELGKGFVSNGAFQVVKPLRYKEFIVLEKNARFVITDSGGIQEETTFLGIPCLTLRSNTERPITVTQGTNELATLENAGEKASSILLGNWKQGETPKLWDGNAARRIVDIIKTMRF